MALSMEKRSFRGNLRLHFLRGFVIIKKNRLYVFIYFLQKEQEGSS